MIKLKANIFTSFNYELYYKSIIVFLSSLFIAKLKNFNGVATDLFSTAQSKEGRPLEFNASSGLEAFFIIMFYFFDLAYQVGNF